MSAHRTPEEQKRRVTAVFDVMASGYDGLRFLRACAERLIERAPLETGARVLDVATGTGLVAMAAAQVVGPSGYVVGVDLAPEMLARAREKLTASGYSHVDFRQGDAERLDFPGGSFDVVLCGSSLFFVPDMPAALREWRRVLRPDGTAGFSAFGSTFLQPLNPLFRARLQQHGVEPPPLPNERLPDEATCIRLLGEAGFAQVEAHVEQVGYFLGSVEERWAEIEAGLEGIVLRRLTPEMREQIKREHLAELAALMTPEGLWVDVPVLLAFGH